MITKLRSADPKKLGKEEGPRVGVEVGVREGIQISMERENRIDFVGGLEVGRYGSDKDKVGEVKSWERQLELGALERYGNLV